MNKKGVRKQSDKQRKRHEVCIHSRASNTLLKLCVSQKCVFKGNINNNFNSLAITAKVCLSSALLLLLKVSVYEITCMYEPERVICM